jgi:predicted dehydrogenase
MSKVRVGLIGCGRISDLHALAYDDNPDAEIYAVCDSREDVARLRAEEWGASRWFTDYRDLLADEAVDAVEILTPHAASERSGKLFRVCENFRYYPPYVKARELMEEGAIGEPLSIRVKVLSGSPQGGWEVPADAWRWRLSEGECGGGPIVFDHGYHIFSIVMYFLGAVEKVFAWIEQVEIGPGLTLDSPAMITWKHREGMRYGSWESVTSPELMIRSKYYADEEFIDITGSKGVIWLNRCSGMMLEQPALVVYRDGETTAYHNLETDWASSFVAAGRDFVAAAREGRSCSLTGSDARDVLQFSLAAHHSAREGREVHLKEMVN